MRLLHLEDHRLSGSIPTEFGKLAMLSDLHAENNRLEGTVPTELGAIGLELTSLYLQNNSLSGTIPTEIRALGNMCYLYLDHNHLSGTVPHEVCDLFVESALALCQLNDNDFVCPLASAPCAARSCYATCK